MHKRVRNALLYGGLALSLGLGGLGAPRSAWAIDRNIRSVLVGGGYGLLGGTVLGLVSWPMTRDTRSIFIGSSVGLYLGIVVGIYYAIDRDNPENPLRSQLPPMEPRVAQFVPPAPPPALVEFQIPVARF